MCKIWKIKNRNPYKITFPDREIIKDLKSHDSSVCRALGREVKGSWIQPKVNRCAGKGVPGHFQGTAEVPLSKVPPNDSNRAL